MCQFDFRIGFLARAALMRHVLGLVILFAVSAPVVAAGDASRGEALYVSCRSCHGERAEGNATMNAPALAGQDAVYLERQLMHFKSGVRGSDSADTNGAQMRAMAATLPDAQAVADVSAWLASLPPAASRGEAPGDLRNGNNYYQSKCGACHGGRAEGNSALFAPRLAGQDLAYLKRQYLAFQQGLRGTHPDDRYGKQMRFMANSLPSEKDLDDVLAFVHAQGAGQ
jgi:cytochrome c oxidase subunit 2